MNPKIKAVFLSPDDRGNKPFCQTCGVYHQLYGNRYHCPSCGGTATPEQAQNVDRKILVADNPVPLVAHRKKGEKQNPDFPAGATVISDEEISS